MSELRNGCGSVRRLLEPYYEGVLTAAQERTVADHLWQCPRCSAELEQIRRVSVALASLPAMDPGEELLASISARLATLPNLSERRRRVNWRRLGLTEVLVLAGLGLGWYVLTLVGPALLREAQPLFDYFRGVGHTLNLWTVTNYHALLKMLGLARSMGPAFGQGLLTMAPRLALYALAQLALVGGTALTIRARHRHTVRRPDPRRC